MMIVKPEVNLCFSLVLEVDVRETFSASSPEIYVRFLDFRRPAVLPTFDSVPWGGSGLIDT